MHEQDNTLRPMSQTDALTQEDRDLILARRKDAILDLISEMTKSLPPMVQMIVNQYHSMVSQFVDRITYEQSEELIDRVQAIIDDIRG